MRSVFAFVVFAALVQSVGFVQLVQAALSFALLCGLLSALLLVGGLLVFGVPGGSFSGALPGESVQFGPLCPAPVPPAPGSVVCCSRGCAGCPVASGVPFLPAPLAELGCAALADRSGRPLVGAALSGRLRRLSASGEFVLA